ncbi:MAG: DUF3830 family protein [archaeon]
MRRIKISFPEVGVEAKADLAESDAPKTCEAIWNLLPIKATALHDIWSGHQVFLFIEPTRIIEYENVSRLLDVNPGDLFYYYRKPHYFRGAPYGKIEASEIGIVYDRDTQPRGPHGVKAVNLFGAVTENMSGLAAACEKMIEEGKKSILLERA